MMRDASGGEGEEEEEEEEENEERLKERNPKIQVDSRLLVLRNNVEEMNE
jgi:hypothetical protein